MALKPVQKTKSQSLYWPMKTYRVILYLLPSGKLNQIRKKNKGEIRNFTKRQLL